MVKNLPAMQETQVWVGKISLEKGMATYSSILAWRIPWTEEPGGLQFMGSQSQTPLKQRNTHTWSYYHFLNCLGFIFCRSFPSFDFLPREVPLAFVVKLVLWCWILLPFTCLECFWFFHQIWMRVLLGRVFLVVGSSLSLF